MGQSPLCSAGEGHKTASPKYSVTNGHKSEFQKEPVATNFCCFGCHLVYAIVIPMHIILHNITFIAVKFKLCADLDEEHTRLSQLQKA